MLDRPNTREGWIARAASLAIEGRAFIGGAYVGALDGGTFAKVSPIDGKVFAHVADCGEADIDRAVKSARAAFESGAWRDADPQRKKKVLLRFAELIREHAVEIALLETLDVGKVIGNSLTVDVPFCADCIQYYAEYADKLFDEIAPLGPQDLALVRKEPLGVVGAIVPWNYPLIIAAWKLGPALLAGNSVILKPAEQSPLASLVLGRLGKEAGLPDGVLNVVPGFGENAGKPLALHPDVDMIAFTGSTEVGKLMMVYAGQSNMKRVALECGGKSPHVVMPDADLDAAAEAIAWGIYYNQGETCHAGSRVLAHASIREALVKKIGEVQQAQIPLGHPFDAGAQLGAMVEEKQMQRVLGYIELGVQEGARDRAWRQAGVRRDRRLLCRADHPRRREQRHAHRPGGDLRPGRRRHPVRDRSRGDSPRQRHDLRPRRRGLDARHGRGAQAYARHSRRDGLGQRLRPLLADDAVRRLQAVRLRPRPVAARNRQVYGLQDDLDALSVEIHAGHWTAAGDATSDGRATPRCATQSAARARPFVPGSIVRGRPPDRRFRQDRSDNDRFGDRPDRGRAT